MLATLAMEASMSRTAKIFMDGLDQAVRLPAEFRFDSEEVYVRRDPETGDIILSQKPEAMSWQQLIALRDSVLGDVFHGRERSGDNASSPDTIEGRIEDGSHQS
jgi:antitoxin VapB